ncbi:transposase family protein [Streptomyces sp. NPDC085540]|uniref:transposase family protein n=1 Tax=Streptomyces sp. NPDC085540 TaxID=3365730 RepID=UPI0037D23D5F
MLACWFGVDRSTITRAIGEVRPLLAARGCTIAAGIRLRTLAEVIDHLGASGQTGIIDGTEIRVRRPAAGRKDREKFISGKHKQNAVKTLVLTDASGRLLFCSPGQPASRADIAHARQLGPGQTPERWLGRGDPRRRRLPGPGRPDRRPRGDTTAPQVQEEPTGLVQGDLRTPVQGTLLSRNCHRQSARRSTAGRTAPAGRTSCRWSRGPPGDCDP